MSPPSPPLTPCAASSRSRPTRPYCPPKTPPSTSSPNPASLAAGAPTARARGPGSPSSSSPSSFSGCASAVCRATRRTCGAADTAGSPRRRAGMRLAGWGWTGIGRRMGRGGGSSQRAGPCSLFVVRYVNLNARRCVAGHVVGDDRAPPWCGISKCRCVARKIVSTAIYYKNVRAVCRWKPRRKK